MGLGNMEPTNKARALARTLIAILELTAIFLIGALFMRWASGQLNLESYREVAATWQQGDLAPWSRMATHELIRHALRYGVVFAIAFAWGYALFKFRPRDYGLTLAGTPLWKHILWGFGIFLVIGLPTKLIIAAMQNAELGEGPAHWAMLESGSGLSFWIFMAVSSYLLPPIFEELFFRGYAQTRLTHVIGAAPAILLISAIFAAMHTQYYTLELTSMVMLVLIVVGAAANGFARHITGSLVTPLVAHALVNIPLPT